MQTVLDNMNDGVMLLGPGLQLSSATAPTSNSSTAARDLRPGISGRDLCATRSRHGGFGPVDDVEKQVEEIAAMVLKPGGVRYERRMGDGRYSKSRSSRSRTAAFSGSTATSPS